MSLAHTSNIKLRLKLEETVKPTSYLPQVHSSFKKEQRLLCLLSMEILHFKEDILGLKWLRIVTFLEEDPGPVSNSHAQLIIIFSSLCRESSSPWGSR